MGNCCCKSQYEIEEANTTDTEVNPTPEKPKVNVVVVNGAPTSKEVIENGGTYTQNVHEPQRGDEQNIVVSTEQAHKHATADGYTTIVANESATQENTQNTSQPRTTDGYSILDKDYVPNENREQDYVINDKREQDYVVNDRRENNNVIHDTREQETWPVVTDGYSMAQSNYINSATINQALPLAADDGRQAMAKPYMPHEITEPALLAGETDGNTTLPAYTPNTLPSGIEDRYSTVPNRYVEAGPTQAPGYTERGVALEEISHSEYEKAVIVSQGRVNMEGYEEVGVKYQGQCYQKRVFDHNLGHYVYIAD